ncbi:phage tail tape measure protein [Devosia sp. SL43]|uniref:phage tail tape measure protein n=1 Tax=Devosia sp. SL43 TaxID=2806348 RepID=UPI001F26DE33|nr:phage tail tape measure protein [Devosia sp. SL43]UJW85767.1 hypothetical protein IM737_00210 [Devosia sp. SL43]
MNEEQLFISVEARLAKLERDWKKVPAIIGRNSDDAERRAQRATKRIEDHFGGLATRVGTIGKTMAVGFVGGLMAGGLAGLAGKFADVAHAIADVGDKAQQAGMNVTAFQELGAVARANRLEVNDLSAAMRELQLRADEWITSGGQSGSAAEAFARIGFTVDDLGRKLKDPSALLSEIIGKVQQLDSAAQIRIFEELFGGDGERMIRLLDDGEAGIKRIIEQARQSGQVFDEQLIARAQELDAAIASAANTVATSLQGAIANAGWQLYNFVQQWWAFEQRTSQSLDQSMRDFGLERLNIENDILTIQRDQQQSGNVNPMIAESRINDARARLQQIADEERQILEILESRKPPKIQAPAIDMPGVAPGWDGFTTAFPQPVAAPASTGGGASVASSQSQASAIDDVIAALREELALMGQSEVERRIDSELRKAGATATDEQRQSIRQLVLAIETEGAALEQLQSAMDGAKGMAKDFLGGLLGDLRNGVDGATALANAFQRLGDRLLDMALDTAINALFASLMNGATGGLGGLFGFAGGGVVQAATGGLIRGPGTGTSDSIPARLSDGEFVVKATATRRNLDLLHAINDGKVAAFATGGLVGDAPTIRAANDNRSAANDNALSVTINAPVTVNASGGTPEANADLAAQVAKQMEHTMRGIAAREIAVSLRPGNILNTKSRR